MEQDETFERELNSLKRITSSHPKYILTLDKTRLGNYDGIVVKYLPDWLLER
jgi:predicted AAA+ superfamily ATPase